MTAPTPAEPTRGQSEGVPPEVGGAANSLAWGLTPTLDPHRLRSARKAVADVMRRERGKDSLETLKVGEAFAANMSVRHLNSGSLDWAVAYAAVWEYVHESKTRLCTRPAGWKS